MEIASLRDMFITSGARIADECPNCRRSTTFELISEQTVHPMEWESPKRTYPGRYVTHRIVLCEFCRNTSVIRLAWPGGEGEFRVPESITVIEPQIAPRELSAHAPENVRTAFREASICENAGALRGAAGLYRLAVEELGNALKADGENLKERIDGLAAKGLSKDIVDALHDARLTGNWSLHGGVTFEPAEIADLAELIAEAVEELYVIPARRQQLAEARKARRTKPSE